MDRAIPDRIVSHVLAYHASRLQRPVFRARVATVIAEYVAGIPWRALPGLLAGEASDA